MICPRSTIHEPCKYTNCPLWNEMRQSCNWATVMNELANLLSKGKPRAQLTPKEQQILQLMTQGYSNQQISDALHIGVSTVKNHVSNILSKLGAKSRVEAVLIKLGSNTTLRRGQKEQ
jgi:DNA-binding NarL/FixJ family response regulator